MIRNELFKCPCQWPRYEICKTKLLYIRLFRKNYEITEISSMMESPSSSGSLSGRSTFKKASGSPTAGMKSGRKGFSLVSISNMEGRYLNARYAIILKWSHSYVRSSLTCPKKIVKPYGTFDSVRYSSTRPNIMLYSKKFSLSAEDSPYPLNFAFTRSII